ncbi:hypothetical protein OUZ56_004266 [Daphnia magna]|uniref:Uncharacterized protein n=1 Tax=Daphnia magna TaxID=35525 RepID=A0ABQ9YP98_9CRUS|nr:hypothetical protein OUZ56_004266 [Daphnia magna]
METFSYPLVFNFDSSNELPNSRPVPQEPKKRDNSKKHPLDLNTNTTTYIRYDIVSRQGNTNHGPSKEIGNLRRRPAAVSERETFSWDAVISTSEIITSSSTL